MEVRLFKHLVNLSLTANETSYIFVKNLLFNDSTSNASTVLSQKCIAAVKRVIADGLKIQTECRSMLKPVMKFYFESGLPLITVHAQCAPF